MDEYTPTTEQVRSTYDLTTGDQSGEFHRWLAGVEREAYMAGARGTAQTYHDDPAVKTWQDAQERNFETWLRIRRTSTNRKGGEHGEMAQREHDLRVPPGLVGIVCLRMGIVAVVPGGVPGAGCC